MRSQGWRHCGAKDFRRVELAQRFNVYGRLFDVERRGDQWTVLAVRNDGQQAPAGFVILGGTAASFA